MGIGSGILVGTEDRVSVSGRFVGFATGHSFPVSLHAGKLLRKALWLGFRLGMRRLLRVGLIIEWFCGLTNYDNPKSRQPFQIMNKPSTWQFPNCFAPVPKQPEIQAGFRYRLDIPESALPGQGHEPNLDPQSGVVGAYRLQLERTEIERVDLNAQTVRCFVWNPDLLDPVVGRCLGNEPGLPGIAGRNRLTLHDASLQGPQLRLQDGRPVLAIAPRFELEWHTEAFAGRLGLIRLVESSRTLTFEDGETYVVLDTESADGGAPVLYLDDAADNNLPVCLVCAFQRRGEKQRFGFSDEISLLIPAEFAGKTVASVSVLEKYTCYFMQNAAPDDPEHIWTPAHWPIVWGWSMRVQPRFDGVWDIFRKKLMMPMPDPEAPQLPQWRSNSRLCRTLRGF